MADAITELRRMKRILILEAVKLGDSHVCDAAVLDELIDARISALKAAQQAEPSDAEIEAWERKVTGSPIVYSSWLLSRESVDWALNLMRRGRGDAKLREAARWICESATETWTDTAPSHKVVAVNTSAIYALRAALGES